MKAYFEKRVAESKAFIQNTYGRVVNGGVDPTELAITKRVRREVGSYRSMFPHLVAAKHLAGRGKRLEEYGSVDFVFLNAEHSNPLRRVLPVDMMGDGRSYYDRRKYGKLVLDVADTVLKPLEKEAIVSQNGDLLKCFE